MKFAHCLHTLFVIGMYRNIFGRERMSVGGIHEGRIFCCEKIPGGELSRVNLPEFLYEFFHLFVYFYLFVFHSSFIFSYFLFGDSIQRVERFHGIIWGKL